MAHLHAEHPERFDPLAERLEAGLEAVVRRAEAPSGPVRVKIGAVAFLRGAGSGYGIGLDPDGHRIEFLCDWRMLRDMEAPLAAGEPVYAPVESWQLLAVDGELRVDLSHDAALERAAFLRSALARMEAPE